MPTYARPRSNSLHVTAKVGLLVTRKGHAVTCTGADAKQLTKLDVQACNACTPHLALACNKRQSSQLSL